MRPFAMLGVLALALALKPSPAPGWEAQTTSAGVTEQAALASTLHQHLSEQLGHRDGLFAPMRVPRGDAAALYEVLDKLNPANGHVPDGKGRQFALAWLAAGAAIADTPAEHAINHFYDPATKSGAVLRGGIASLRRKLTSAALRESLVSGGVPATEWLTSAENPMGVSAFLSQYRKAVSSRTPAERERHAAATLLAAGAIVHIITDMAAPAHVRGDVESFFQRLGKDQTDVGSRFERVAALAYGRLGVVRPEAPATKQRLVDFITSADGTGLADLVSTRYFSVNTLPRSIEVLRGESGDAIGNKLKAALVRAAPAPVGPFDMGQARSPAGARLEGADGICLAHYFVDGTTMSFAIPDSCALEQISALLPLAASYGAGALDFLFRGTLAVEAAGSMLSVTTTDIGLGAGSVLAFWDDELGVRTQYAQLDAVTGAVSGASLGLLGAPPESAKAIAVVFSGSDSNGEPVTAALYRTWPLTKP